MSVLIGIVALAAIPIAGQQSSRPAGTNGAAAKAYKAPRTPDGQPDLQGYWTNSTYTPLERPDGVTKELYTPEEFDKIAKAAAEREGEQTEPGTIADVHYDFTQFGLDRSQSAWARDLRTSLIVDPPDGKIPPLTTEGRKLAADRAAARKALGGPNDAVQNMPIGTRCIIMAGSGPPLMSSGYNANYEIVQAPGHAMILTEMIHDARIIPLDMRPQPPAERSPVGRRLARPLGRRNAGGRDDELQRQEPVQGIQREPARGRAVHARRRRHHRLQIHRRRCVDVDKTLDRRGAAAEDRWSDLRACLS